MIDSDQAGQLAIAYVSSLNLKGYRYEYSGVNKEKYYTGEWGVMFDVYAPEGHLMDNHAIFFVNPETGKIRAFGG